MKGKKGLSDRGKEKKLSMDLLEFLSFAVQIERLILSIDFSNRFFSFVSSGLEESADSWIGCFVYSSGVCIYFSSLCMTFMRVDSAMPVT